MIFDTLVLIKWCKIFIEFSYDLPYVWNIRYPAGHLVSGTHRISSRKSGIWFSKLPDIQWARYPAKLLSGPSLFKNTTLDLRGKIWPLRSYSSYYCSFCSYERFCSCYFITQPYIQKHSCMQQITHTCHTITNTYVNPTSTGVEVVVCGTGGGTLYHT